MAERVDQLIPYGYAETWIATFHAFGDRVLRKERARAGAQPRISACSPAPSRSSSCASASSSSRSSTTGRSAIPPATLHALLTLVSRAKDEDVAPDAYRA